VDDYPQLNKAFFNLLAKSRIIILFIQQQHYSKKDYWYFSQDIKIFAAM